MDKNYIKKLTDQFISEEDSRLFSEVVGNSIEDLLKEEFDTKAFFEPNKHIASDVDEAGLHALRSLLSENIIRSNRIKAGLNDSEFGTLFDKNGILVINDFDLNNRDQVNTYVNILKILEYNPNAQPGLFQELVTHDDKDPQYNLHVDIFFTSLKTFIYKQDTPIELGPYSYVVGSHRNDKARLSFVHKEACRLSKWKLHQINTGWESIYGIGPSFRMPVRREDGIDDYSITDTTALNSALNSLGFANETPIVGKNNTMIITDTSGLHRRYPAKPGVKRDTYRHQSPRQNPFKII